MTVAWFQIRIAAHSSHFLRALNRSSVVLIDLEKQQNHSAFYTGMETLSSCVRPGKFATEKRPQAWRRVWKKSSHL